jgi:hypothetical protein
MKSESDIINELIAKDKYEEWVSLGSKFGLISKIKSKLPFRYYDMNDNVVSFTRIESTFNKDFINIPVFNFVSSDINVYSTYVNFINDHSTCIPLELIKAAKSINIVDNTEYKVSELKGFCLHGIKDKIQVFMKILKTNNILPQKYLTDEISQLTVYREKERSQISFTVFGQGKISHIYGANGIVFLSTDIYLQKFRSNMPFEWFHLDKLPLDNLIIGVSKTFASQNISSLSCQDIASVRNNNKKIRQNIINLLHSESGLEPPIIETNDEFYDYYHKCLSYIVNPDDPVDCTIYELIQALKIKYNCTCKIIIIDYLQ